MEVIGIYLDVLDLKNWDEKSWTWNYFEEVNTEEQTGDKGESLKRCKFLDANGKICGALYINDSLTGNAINHLLTDHEISKDGEINKNQQTIQTVMRVHKHKDNRQKELRKFLTDWIIDDLQPLYVVQSPLFCRLISELDPAFIMPDEKGIKKVISNAYNYTLPALIKKIKLEAKNISLTTDMWTSRGGQGYIGITCSYVDSNFNLNEITLTVNYVRYPHTAQHITESLEEILEKWNLRDKVFTITTDNAANMKKAISNMNAVEWQECSAHILQLIIGKGLVPVKALIMRVKRLIEFFLRPKQSERLKDIQKKYPNANKKDTEDSETDIEDEQEENIDAKDTAKYLHLINDVATHLDSKKDGKKLKEIMISDYEWDLLTDLKEILSLFAEATTELRGSKYVTNSLRVRMLIEIINTLTTNPSENYTNNDEQEDAFEDEGNFNISEPVLTFGLLDEGKSKLYANLKKYYPTLTTETLIPSILDPRFKSLDFAPDEQKIKTEQYLHKLFEKEKGGQKEHLIIFIYLVGQNQKKRNL
ncbi:unnamed protein product [Rhizophagus irregularis]|uniref:Zinc finger bed domain-containing protein 1-like n=1 Tax=Rhizophagus irregularis TaxID=588596 RepID=A0A916EF90_9GLOM|nr:unnamed protein product [Rhizophagus irregularis]